MRGLKLGMNGFRMRRLSRLRLIGVPEEMLGVKSSRRMVILNRTPHLLRTCQSYFNATQTFTMIPLTIQSFKIARFILKSGTFRK